MKCISASSSYTFNLFRATTQFRSMNTLLEYRYRMQGSKKFTPRLLRLLDLFVALCGNFCLVARLFDLDSGIDSQFKHFGNTLLLLRRTLNVFGVHLLGNGFSLFRRYWCKTLCSKELNASTLRAKIGLEANKDQRSGWAEMKDFGVPLCYVSMLYFGRTSKLTLSMTFSRELGQSMAKQTKRRSVSGYDSGLNRSYSSCPAVSHRASSTDLPDGTCET